MASTSTSKLPKPSGLRPARKILPGSKELPAFPTSHFNTGALRRRSKSFTDLTMNVLKPFKPTNTKLITKATSSISLPQGIKRTGPAVKPDIKAKISRTNATGPGTSNVEKKENKPASAPSAPPKRKAPPAYDFKARFYLLKEQHDFLKTSLANAKEQLGLSHTWQTENVELKDKVINLEKERSHFESQCCVLKNECNMLHIKVETDTIKIEELNCKLTDLERKYIKAFNELSLANEMLKHYNTALAEVASLKEEVTNCQAQLQQDGVIRRALHNQVQDLKGNIRVFCRVRPALCNEVDLMQCNINYIDNSTLDIRKTRESVSTNMARNNELLQEFTYDQIFSPQHTQVEVFEELSQLVQSALDGYHVCVFAYGQTGSGKTFTMQGDNTENTRGMIPRSIECLFQRVTNLKLSGWSYEVHVSFLEIYNEQIRDLLNTSDKQTHNIRYNEGKGVTVTNLQIEPINSELDFKVLMTRAEENRSVAKTNYNQHSSRSHAVTKIYLRGVQKDSEIVYTGSINLVDLAGSECAKTASTDRIAETKHINKSLAALGNVMLALHNKDSHIPYRDSKLTYLLQSCLGGNSKTLMIVNIAPFEDCYQESVNSLRFAAKVKEVKTNSKRNRTINQF